MFKHLEPIEPGAKNFAKQIYTDLLQRFWSGEFDHLTGQQLREQVRQSVSDEVYSEYLKLIGVDTLDSHIG